MKFVSVVIPIYNVEEYIEECLVSVLNQTLKNIEIICVNDGTPDNSMEIVERYAKEDERIIIINKENGGLSSARNAGLQAATGEYVYFMDSDDYILNDTLEVLYNEAQENNLDTIYFDADSFFETKELEERHQSYITYYHRTGNYCDVVSGQEMLAKMIANNEFRPSACLQMNKRMLLSDNQITFYPGIIHEDNLFTLLVTLDAKKVKHIPQAFYMRRMREDSIMTNINKIRSCEGYFICIKELIEKIEQKVDNQEYLDAYMNRIRTMRNISVKNMKGLSVEDRDILLDRVEKDRCLFELIFNDYFHAIQKNEQEKKNSKAEIAKLKKENKKIKKSNSYKIGRIVTFVPRAFKVLKRKGFRYCLDKVLYRIAPNYCENNIKVSVIMPVYNGKKYLKECLDSLCKQTLKGIEIICVDDESTDGSLEILHEYQQKDKRVRIFNQSHMGAGSARNIGLKESKGKYLLFLDSDDYFDKHMCEKAYYHACKYKAQIVMFGAQRRDMQTGKMQKMTWVLRSEELPKDKAFRGRDISERIFQVTSNAAWTKLYEKEYIIKQGLEFQNIKHTNDAYFTRSAMAMADRVAVLDEVLLTYRYNDGDNTQSIKHLEPLEFYKAFKAVKEKLEAEKLFDVYRISYINWVLTESLFNYDTMKTEEAKETIKKKLLPDGFDELEVSSITKETCISEALFEKYQNFIN